MKNPEDLMIFSNFHTPQGYRSQMISDLPTFNFILLYLFVLLNPVTSWRNLARDLSSPNLQREKDSQLHSDMNVCVCVSILFMYIYYLCINIIYYISLVILVSQSFRIEIFVQGVSIQSQKK